MSKFFEDFVSRYDDMMHGAIKGAAFMYMLNESKEADVEEIIKKYEYIDSLNLCLAEDTRTGECVLSLQAEIDGEIHNSLDYDSEIRIGEDLRVRHSGELETEFEYLALSVLTVLSMAFISEMTAYQEAVNIDFAKLK